MNSRRSFAEESDLSIDVPGVEPITGWHPLAGLPIGVLHGLSPGTDVQVIVEEVLETTPDLAIADRVAWVHSERTAQQHIVLATPGGYLVATVSPQLDWAAAQRMQTLPHAPAVVSVANADGVLPVLVAVAG